MQYLLTTWRHLWNHLNPIYETKPPNVYQVMICLQLRLETHDMSSKTGLC